MQFECHITCNLEDHAEAQKVADENDWKTSEIARDPILGQATYFYLTLHDDSFIDLYRYMENMEERLVEVGVVPVRKKIELTLFDTKNV